VGGAAINRYRGLILRGDEEWECFRVGEYGGEVFEYYAGCREVGHGSGFLSEGLLDLGATGGVVVSHILP